MWGWGSVYAGVIVALADTRTSYAGWLAAMVAIWGFVSVGLVALAPGLGGLQEFLMEFLLGLAVYRMWTRWAEVAPTRSG